jgi:hypothetical protein
MWIATFDVDMNLNGYSKKKEEGADVYNVLCYDAQIFDVFFY